MDKFSTQHDDRKSEGRFYAYRVGAWLMSATKAKPTKNGEKIVALLTPSQKNVGFAIASHLNNKTRLAYPSVETIARHAGIDTRNVWVALKALRKLGILDILDDDGTVRPIGTPSGRLNRYRFNHPADLVKSIEVKGNPSVTPDENVRGETNATPDENCSEPLTITAPTPDDNCQNPRRNRQTNHMNQKEPTHNPQTAGVGGDASTTNTDEANPELVDMLSDAGVTARQAATLAKRDDLTAEDVADAIAEWRRSGLGVGALVGTLRDPAALTTLRRQRERKAETEQRRTQAVGDVAERQQQRQGVDTEAIAYLPTIPEGDRDAVASVVSGLTKRNLSWDEVASEPALARLAYRAHTTVVRDRIFKPKPTLRVVVEGAA